MKPYLRFLVFYRVKVTALATRRPWTGKKLVVEDGSYC